ncbi:LEAF RUST 10 DISEASE-RESISTANCEUS RECEPTOR-LIKE PROTEIN KINASE-like 1.2 isoform X2 [Primulina eburnea]|uniref:LEAF RUST 10 DISEASE-RESISTANCEUS RECEPTOR-LIKE PROTEIN KINASE-like 1.2 isoform X2 n=1 Tax=Primulina eburnea TaxID=1245227 RepID=UPI003C6BE865
MLESKKIIHPVTIIMFFSLFVKKSTSTNTSSTTSCAIRTCNGLIIRHPFRVTGLDQPHCGLPEFDVSCDENKPLIRINDHDLIVKDVFYDNNSLLLAMSEVYDFGNKCPVPTHNFSLDRTSFSYGPSTDDLFIFYGCATPYEQKIYKVDCASNGSQHSFAVFHVELGEHMNYSIESCQDLFNTPAGTYDLGTPLNMSYVDILKKGFVLRWEEAEDCKGCERNGRRLNLGLKIGIGIGAAAVTALTMSTIFFVYHRRLQKLQWSSSSVSHPSSVLKDLEKPGVHVFSYRELDEATQSFDPRRELGDGGYGAVYKGKLRDGRVVAVKRLYENNCRRVEQFMNEIEILTRMRHQNLVSLYGCTSRSGRDLLLVYEYIPNGTLADHLHGKRVTPKSLSWAARLNIAIETASALAYLHASDVIHRDVKSSNILLDNNLCVKVADFGISRLLPLDVTHVSTAPQGTLGYIDPEYHQCYQLTEKSDVYSFGVVLVELISSKTAVDITRHRDEINLSSMAINMIKNDELHDLVDKDLGFESDYWVRTMVNAVAELAFHCLQNGREMRPYMKDVVNVLREIQSKAYTDIPADDIALLKSADVC